MKKVSLVILAALTVLAFSISGMAQNNLRVYTLSTADDAKDDYKARPGVYDPDKTNAVEAKWIQQVGLPDDSGKGNFALYLQKFASTGANCAAGAVIDKVKGITLTELGFDYRNDSHIGYGAPRFMVYATDGLHIVGLRGIELAPPAPGWTRVVYYPQDSHQFFPVMSPTATVISIQIVFDEGLEAGNGYAYLDNINVNGQYITKPGTAK